MGSPQIFTLYKWKLAGLRKKTTVLPKGMLEFNATFLFHPFNRRDEIIFFLSIL